MQTLHHNVLQRNEAYDKSSLQGVVVCVRKRVFEEITAVISEDSFVENFPS